ncbi:hypothetical protein HanXRQr2_Chr10g0450351 [Helianthus annuus]|uniref:Uncharacterized protein n=1 Tax=Helianthus annuus TaxID=4232 RepID=A0A9K3N4N4_HELAN|nr:hypothetical protein HanXRQr2_Chr10g0450351 [Helianthus annuus]
MPFPNSHHPCNQPPISGVDVADVSSDTRSTGDIVKREARNERV